MIVDRFAKINRIVFMVAFAIMAAGSCDTPAVAQDAAKSKKAKPPATYEAIGAFADPRIRESSGVVMATAKDENDPPAFWTFNDSGGQPRLFRVELPGKTTATVTLAGAKNADWEAMCTFSIGQQRYLAVADVGDNRKRRKRCQIYICPEPTTPFPQEVACQTLDFKYENGPLNCEAISYNAADDSFWLIEKVYLESQRKTPPGIYRLANPLAVSKTKQPTKTLTPNQPSKPTKHLVAKKIGTFNVRNVTGMAFSPDGTKLVVRSYFACYLFNKAKSKSWQETVAHTKAKTILCPLQSQGESICFLPNSDSMLLTSELAKATIWKIVLSPATSSANEKSE